MPHVSRPQPAAGHETAADVLYEARVMGGYNSKSALAKALAAALNQSLSTVRGNLGQIERGERGISDQYARAIHTTTGMPLRRLRAAKSPAGLELIAAALDEQNGVLAELVEKVDRLLVQRQDGGRDHA